jgi:hypothetical protein
MGCPVSFPPGVVCGSSVLRHFQNGRPIRLKLTAAATGAAAATTIDNITLGNGSNIVADNSIAGQVNVTLGSGANLVVLGDGLSTGAGFEAAVTASTRAGVLLLRACTALFWHRMS